MKIKEVKAISKNLLQLKDEHGNNYVYDMRYLQELPGKFAQELNNYDYFKQVRLLPGWNSVEWPNHQDVAPHDIDKFAILIE